ncbi:MAG: pyruvate, water dikinase regulatory protein [Gammaproteobacteria bacterium]|nr:pyruvate, water dikinase regulatory protein [Gammaproteobacteria bacterium]
MEKARTAFFVSDRTGITAETLGHSLLTQFDGVNFRQVTVPFMSSVDKAEAFKERLAATAREEGEKPIVFSTLIDDEIRDIVSTGECLFLDFFDAFIGPLEKELQIKSSHTAGRAHGMQDQANYTQRIEAMNFALANDDGITTRNYDKSDVILVGVSRSGKTPTCLYLALHYGLFAANYPLTEEELESGRFPKVLLPYRHKLFGLTIDPGRLQQIRSERRPDSRYASAGQVNLELRQAENMYRTANVPFTNTTNSSIEEIATTIIHETGIKRRFF